MKIIVDAMGGDHAPGEIVAGALSACKKFNIEAVLVGREDALRPLIPQDAAGVSILPAADVIGMEDDPTALLKTKKESSMAVALRALKDDAGDALVSAGSTGALLVGATMIVRRIPGIRRAALAPLLPTAQGNALLIDCGANVECTPEYLLQFATMGAHYMQSVLGVAQPRVGLLNIGEEEEKGCQLTKATYALLKKAKLNFTGNVEARGVLNGGADVIVCDGYHGNLVIKASEGAISAIFKMLRRELNATFISKLGAALSRPAFRRVKRRMDVNEVGGGPLLGVRGAVVKPHGNSTGHAFFCCLRQARQMLAGNVVGIIEQLEQIEGGNENV